MQFIGPWDDGAAIPEAFTCEGAGDAPLITWTAPPDGTAALAMSAIDPDADAYVHWLVIGLPPEAGSLGGDEPVTVGTEALNSSGTVGWLAPCPPPGGGPHSYVFTLNLLDAAVALPADTPTGEVLAAVEAVTTDTATFSGTYSRT
jgi:phosphatidylethanolamine-binding protein (PEBP) family uncharacterized protein